MKSGSAKALTMAIALSSAQAVLAHPGHVHDAGPAHGTSWMDLVLFLATAVVVPVATLLVVHLRGRRSR